MSARPPPPLAHAPEPVEALKNIVDFSKVLLAIDAAILSAVASAVVLGAYHFTRWTGWLSPALCLLSAGLCIVGFGKAIGGLKTGKAVRGKVAAQCCNYSSWMLFVAIVLAPFTMQVRAGTTTVDEVLDYVERTTKHWPNPLTAKNCREIKYSGSIAILLYDVGNAKTQTVTFSTEEGQIRDVSPN